MTQDDNAMWPGVVKGLWALAGLVVAVLAVVVVALVLR
jgi:hypothetical protein